jgi:hypothetical protein
MKQLMIWGVFDCLAMAALVIAAAISTLTLGM